MILQRIAGFLIACILFCLRLTWRIRVSGTHYVEQAQQASGDNPCLFAVLHGHQMSLIAYNPYPKLGIITSQSKDGEIAATVLKLFSMHPIRGSSSKGGQHALQAAIQHVQSPASVAITVDGPRGPRGKAKRGICEIARQTGRTIVPMVAVPKKRKETRSWDRFQIPYPFTTVAVLHGPPISVPPQGDEQSVFTACHEIEKALEELERAAEAFHATS